jgi:hypothetical protein
MTLTMDEVRTITAQEKWTDADTYTRQQMLGSIGYPSSYASTSWKRLPHMVRVNLENKMWTA